MSDTITGIHLNTWHKAWDLYEQVAQIALSQRAAKQLPTDNFKISRE